jgi:alkanesulfonate monooxygenase SsuD/methylene tetrahydromethanopterin reductase-like flavin-dependent oxidoreductase (luciferase family)
MNLVGITMPNRTAPLRKIPEYAELADAAGFDSVWSYELYKNPFSMLCTSALRTEQALLGTGLATAFRRSPFEAANSAADVDELSQGRMLLGLGTGLPPAQYGFHSVDTTHWVTKMREYIHAMRLGWEFLYSGEVEPYEGKYYRFAPPEGDPWGLRELARPRIPIYLGAHGPMMLQLAGEIAEGWIATLTSPKWVRERVRPELEKGAQRRPTDAGEVEIAVEVVCSVHPDRDLAYRRAKTHIGFYSLSPLMNAVAKLHGLGDECDEIRAKVMAGGFDALIETPDALVDALAIAGTPEEGRQKLRVWQEEIPHVVFHTPYVPPLTAEESEDIYRNIVSAFGETTARRTQAQTTSPAGA